MKVLILVAMLAVSGVMSAPAPEPAPAPGPAPSGLLSHGVVTTSVLTPNVVLVPAVNPYVHSPLLINSHGVIGGVGTVFV